MKIVYTGISIQGILNSIVYKTSGNTKLNTDKNVHYPVNVVLSKTLKKNEKTKVVLIITEDEDKKWETNLKIFKDELQQINTTIGADIIIEEIHVPYSLTKNENEFLFRKIIATLETGAEIITDITYGTKILPIVMFCALAFAEKYFDASIEYITYGKVDFTKGTGNVKNAMLFDVTSLFYLNSLTNTIDCPTGDAAIKMIDKFFEM